MTDSSVAPEGKENLFVLVPIASDLTITELEKEAYADRVLSLMESEMNLPNLREKIEYKRIYTVDNFAADYNSFKGSALGLAHTLRQTAIFRPKNKSKKVSNLFYVGAGTNPGIGTQICLISAELAYKRVHGITTAEPLAVQSNLSESDLPKDYEAGEYVYQGKGPIELEQTSGSY